MDISVEMLEDEDDNLPMKHRVAKLIITSVGALFVKEILSVYYDHVLTTRREAKEKDRE
jgi:hypothetical protein